MSSASEQHHIKAADDTVEQPGVDATPPTLPAPQLDLSISIDSILDAGAKNSAKEAEKLEKLSEENERLDEKLKEMQNRLAAAEQKSKELEAKRRSQLAQCKPTA